MKPWARINASRKECPNCGRKTYLFTSNQKYQCHFCGFGYREDYEEIKKKKASETKDPYECSGCHQDLSACICNEANMK
jgi:ribosomal protein L37E